jgi:tetratricopeptide (TPR) repeat protein
MSEPGSTEDLLKQADQLILEGRLETALDLFRSRLAQEPTDKKIHDWIFSLLSAHDQGRGLVDFYRDVQKTHPDDWRHLVNLARAYSQTGKDSLAVVQLQKLLRTDSTLREVWIDLALCYQRLDKLELALRALNSLLDLHPDCSEAHTERVRLLVRSGDLQEATAAAIFSLEVSNLEPPVRDWLEEVDLVLEVGDTPNEDLLDRLPALSGN